MAFGAFRATPAGARFVASMSRKGNCYDKAHVRADPPDVLAPSAAQKPAQQMTRMPTRIFAVDRNAAKTGRKTL